MGDWLLSLRLANRLLTIFLASALLFVGAVVSAFSPPWGTASLIAAFLFWEASWSLQ